MPVNNNFCETPAHKVENQLTTPPELDLESAVQMCPFLGCPHFLHLYLPLDFGAAVGVGTALLLPLPASNIPPAGDPNT